MHVAINAQLLSSETGYRQSGVSRYIANLLPALVRAGTEVSRWTIFLPPGVNLPELPATAATIIPINSVLPTNRPVARIIWEQAVAPLAIARRSPDVMLCPLNVVPLLAPCPTVVTVHDLAFLRLKTHRYSRRSYLSLMTRHSVRRSAHVIAISDFTRAEVMDLLNVSPDRVTTIPNGCDPAFAPIRHEDAAAWRKKHGLPDRYLLFVGTLEPRKNLIGLIEAYAEFRKVHNIPLVVVGAPGWRYTPIFEAVKSLGVDSGVRFEGFVSNDDLPYYYAGSTAFIYPSFYEGFGLPLLEAMRMGTPVITSNSSSMPEVVGDAAILINPQSRQDLLQAMNQVVNDDRLRSRLIVDGRARAKLFDWQTSADAMLNILRSTVGIKPMQPEAVGPPAHV